MLIRLGVIVLFIAMMTADSDRLIVPTVLMLIGTGLIYAGKNMRANDGKQG